MPTDMNSEERQPLLDNNTNTTTSHNVDDTTIKPAPGAGDVKGHRLRLAIVFPLLGLLFVALDVTMVSTVSATIAAEFSSLAVVSWLGSAYLTAVAAIQPISGALTNHFGRRTGFFFALACFAAGNLMCGVASTETILILGRVVAGIGGGAISSIGAFIIGDLVSLRERPFWQGLQNVFWAFGMGIGGIFGGTINDAIGWRWTFLALLPGTLFVAIGCFFFIIPGLPRPKEGDEAAQPAKGIDVIGTVLLTGALVSFVLGLNLQEGGENKVASLVLVVVSAIFFIAFVVAEIWFVANPVIPVHLLRNRSVAGSCLAGFLVSISMHSLLFYGPILVQTRGFSASQTGLQMLGHPLGGAIAPVSVGIALRAMGSYGVIKPLVFLVYLVGPIGFYFSTLSSPAWTTIVFMTFLGAGFGSILTFNLIGLLANIDDALQATATAMLYAFRQTGASAGVAIAGIVFRARIERELPRRLSQVSDLFSTLTIPESISYQCKRVNYIDGQPPRICQVYVDALHDVFILTLTTAVAATICGMLIRNRSLDRGNGTPKVQKNDVED